MTNREKYRTSEERTDAYIKQSGISYDDTVRLGIQNCFEWLESEEEKEPMKFKPCPFCDGKATMTVLLGLSKPDRFRVECGKCRVATRYYSNRRRATYSWNKRAKNYHSPD